MQQTQHDGIVSAFPVSVVTANQVFGIAINDLVMWATLAYVLIQIVVILPKLKATVVQAWKRWRKGEVCQSSND